MGPVRRAFFSRWRPGRFCHVTRAVWPLIKRCSFVAAKPLVWHGKSGLAASVQDLPLLREVASQSWALNTFLYLNTKYKLKMYLNTKYVIKMYLNTKYFLQMYLNTKYIDVFKYFFILFSKYRPYSLNPL